MAYVEPRKQGFIIRRMWVCVEACGGTHYTIDAAVACEERHKRRRARAASQ